MKSVEFLALMLYFQFLFQNVLSEKRESKSRLLDVKNVNLDYEVFNETNSLFEQQRPKNADPCSPNPCVNGGICETKGKSFSCDCPSNFVGETCQEKCDCENGICRVSSSNEVICECFPEYGKNNDVCTDCDCGTGANCTFERGFFGLWVTKYCLCPDGSELQEKHCKGTCKDREIPLLLGIGKEHFCLRVCNKDDDCERDYKCVSATGSVTKLCAPKCDADDDCEYPTKCNLKERYCFWEKCKSDADCKRPLTCHLPQLYFKEKLCTRRLCDRDTECADYQICHPKTRACQCPTGMSGSECEVAEWCTENGKFKDCKGANGTCEYVKSRGAISCVCAYGKKLHPVENKCKATCASRADCKHGGTCEVEGGYYKFCSCKLGIIGDKCETVFDCTPDGKYKNCESSGGKCFYDGTKAICECPGDKKLNDKQFICEACKCRGGECIIKDGIKGCKCPPGYGNFTNLSCRACDCGPETSCIWEARFGGDKICLCNSGYSTKKGKCEACECGPDSECEWISEGWLKPEKKVCHCKPGYHEKNGKCVDQRVNGNL